MSGAGAVVCTTMGKPTSSAVPPMNGFDDAIEESEPPLGRLCVAANEVLAGAWVPQPSVMNLKVVVVVPVVSVALTAKSYSPTASGVIAGAVVSAPVSAAWLPAGRPVMAQCTEMEGEPARPQPAAGAS